MSYEYAVPVYISARNPDELMFAMAKNNRKQGLSLRYFDIQYANGLWFAWYYIENKKAMSEKMNEVLPQRQQAVVDG